MTKFEDVLSEAAQGVIEAQVIVGISYLNGYHAKKDIKTAIEWFVKAADQGDVEAQDMLRFIYQRGEGVPRDFEKAAFWARKAAAYGHVASLVALGNFYQRGVGVNRDKARACACLRIAQTCGLNNWLNNITANIYGRSLSAEEGKQSRRYIDDWKRWQRQNLARAGESPMLFSGAT